MTRRSRPDDLPEDELGQVRDDEGLVVDEYTSDAFADPDDLDVMDVPDALVADERALEELADDGDGIEEMPLADVRMDQNDEAEMGLGAEPRSPEELEQAAIGHELRGRAGVTRDDQVHGERLLDAPEGNA